MRTLKMQVDALMRLCTAENEMERVQAREDIRRILENCSQNSAHTDPEYVIRELLLELGVPDHLVGHPYVVQAILLAVRERKYIDSITFSLYPQLAVMFDTTAPRVERAIRHLIEITWSRSDMDVLNRYFGNTVSPERGKPTNGEFLARITNLVKQRLREAA